MDTRSKSTRFSALRNSTGFSLLEVMVALAILGVAVVAIFQLFSVTLRTVQKADRYTKGLFYVRSLLDEAYSAPDIEQENETFDLEGDFKGTRQIELESSTEDESVRLYRITVTVTWPVSGSIRMWGVRTVYEYE